MCNKVTTCNFSLPTQFRKADVTSVILLRRKVELMGQRSIGVYHHQNSREAILEERVASRGQTILEMGIVPACVLLSLVTFMTMRQNRIVLLRKRQLVRTRLRLLS